VEIFSTIDLLKNHYIVIHHLKNLDEEKTEENEVDKDYFNDSSEQSNQSEQLPEKEPNKEKYFSEKICKICNQKFKNKKTLTKHIKHVHHKLKQLICNVCNKAFTRKATLDVR
jgi:uncharacterized Zn-finger protein